MHIDLYCTACEAKHDPARRQNVCRGCGKPLFARYDLNAIRNQFRPLMVRARPARSMWKFIEVLPVSDPRRAVSLGEGLTPLLRLNRRGPFQEWENLWVKDESFNPTASFKARGLAAAVTRAAELDVETVALPSAGNAAGAAAAYCARVGLRCVQMMPVDTPPTNIIESVAQGAEVYLVQGLISDAGRLVRECCDRFGWFDLSTLREPFRVEGKKIMGYELALGYVEGPVLAAATSSGFQSVRLRVHTNHISFPDPSSFLDYWRATSLYVRTPGADKAPAEEVLSHSSFPFLATKRVALLTAICC